MRLVGAAVLCLALWSCKKENLEPLQGDVPTGTAKLSPDKPVHVSETGTWTVTYSVPEGGIVTGGGIALHISPWWGWTEPQSRWQERPGYTTFKTSRRGISLDLVDGGELCFVVGRLQGGSLSEGDQVTMVYGDTSGGRFPLAKGRADRYAEKEEEFFLKVDRNGDGIFTPLEKSPSLEILPGSVRKLSIVPPVVVSIGERVPVKVSCLDLQDNLCKSVCGRCFLRSKPEEDPIVVQIENGIGQTVLSGLEEGVYQCSGQFEMEGEEDVLLSGESEWFFVAEWTREYDLYVADLHGHSSLSDGTGSPEDYYHYARWVSGLDAAALTDHDALGLVPMDDNMWMVVAQATREAQAPGLFISFLGYEWTDWTFGHSLVLFPGEQGTWWSHMEEASNEPDELWDMARERGAICIPHHLGGGPVAFQTEHIEEEVSPVVEICSIHGVSDRRGAPCGIYGAMPEYHYYWDVVRAGKKIGVTANGDSHNGHPGRRDPRAVVSGLTVLWAKELTRADLWQALSCKRTCATSGRRGFALLQVNGVWQGGVVPQSKDVVVEMEAFCQSETFQVHLLLNGVEARRFEGESHRFKATLEGDVAFESGSCLSLYCIGAEEDQLWTSPIWFE